MLTALIWCAALSAEENAWSRVSAPSSATPQVFGFYSAGCIAGASALPLQGIGYRVMRPSRNRYYGHLSLIAFVESLSRQVAVHDAYLLIGDLSQPRGGPMAFGHASHQVGLDVDIWFRLEQSKRRLSQQEAEHLPMISVIRPARGALDMTRWSPRFRDILKWAAESPDVERIFINPIIKQHLCRHETQRAWLHKLRPWWGHDSHFHVRLRCPAGNTQCKIQKPPPPGDGCDEGIDNWIREIQLAALAPPKKIAPKKKKALVLPDACTILLQSAALQFPMGPDLAPRLSGSMTTVPFNVAPLD